MPFELLHDRLPELAEAETRTVTILDDSRQSGLPPGDYSFLEMYCNEPGCDCRRVFFWVVSSNRPAPDPLAVIAYGWENDAFYRKWCKFGCTKEDLRLLKGPVLNLGSPESTYSDAILQLFIDYLLPQTEYIDRLKRHYRQFRATVDKPPSPAWRQRRATGG